MIFDPLITRWMTLDDQTILNLARILERYAITGGGPLAHCYVDQMLDALIERRRLRALRPEAQRSEGWAYGVEERNV